ncbi:MAG: hypothetical protein QOG33_1930 [Gaiellales bacterium]|nr:hypothetical protein [Gaiellales bacterium]
MSAGEHLTAALEAEREAHEALLHGRPAAGMYARARDAYLASHAESGPESWGRLIGALKMAILAGDGVEPIARRAIADTDQAEGAAAGYARALARVSLGEAPDVSVMLAQGDAFARTGRALAALAVADRAAYAAAVDEILADFAAREQHLSGVVVADTALVLERLAEPLGLAARPVSPLLPASVYSDPAGL